MSQVVHNFERQLIFSNREHNINPNDNITATIAPSGDNSYFNLHDSYFQFNVKFNFKGVVDSGGSNVALIPLKKNYSGLIANSRCVYTMWNSGALETVTMTGDSENLGMHRSILKALRTSKKERYINEGFKELSFVYDQGLVDSANNAVTNFVPRRPHGNQLFYNYIHTSIPKDASNCSAVVIVPFQDVFEGCGGVSPKFPCLTQFDMELMLQDAGNWLKKKIGSSATSDDRIVAGKENSIINSAVITDASIYYHSYVTNDTEFFDPEDTKLSPDQILIKSFYISSGSTFFSERVLYNFPAKHCFIYFTDDKNDFSELEPVKFSRLSLLMSGEAKRNFLPMYNSDGVDPTFFEYMQHIINTTNEDNYETLFTYETYRDQFRMVGLPLCELFAQKATNQLNFEMEFKSATTKAMYMHMVFVRSD